MGVTLLKNISSGRLVPKNIISTLKPLFMKARVIAVVIILSSVFITLAIAEAPSVAPTVPGMQPKILSICYYNNNTTHFVNFYYDQYGQPMKGARVADTITNNTTELNITKCATINSNGYALINVTGNLTGDHYYYRVPPIPPVNASAIAHTNYGRLRISHVPVTNNFTVSGIDMVQGLRSYENAILFLYYNSRGYKAPEHEYMISYTNNPSFSGPGQNYPTPKKIVSGNFSAITIGNYNYKVIQPDYASISNINGMVFAYPSVYHNGSWQGEGFAYVINSRYGNPPFPEPAYVSPTENGIIAPIYHIFFGFPAILPVLLGILSEVIIFGLPRSSGTIDLYLSRSGNKYGILVKRFLGSLILLAIGIFAGIIAFIFTVHYYIGFYPPLKTVSFVFLSLFLVGTAFISISFMISSRAKSTTANVLSPFAIFFGLFYLLNMFFSGIYSLLVTKGIFMNPFIVDFIELLDPFNVLVSMEKDLVPHPTGYIRVPVPFGFTLIDYIAILVLWAILPVIAAFVLWRKAN